MFKLDYTVRVTGSPLGVWKIDFVDWRKENFFTKRIAKTFVDRFVDTDVFRYNIIFPYTYEMRVTGNLVFHSAYVEEYQERIW